VFSLGYDDLSDALSGKDGWSWKLALLLLAAKFIATICSYGFGGCGGIFSPCLFFGCMVGIAVARLVGLEFHMAHADLVTLAVVGMSATLGGVVGAPVTGILIVFEMTHEFSLVPALMLGALVSQAISRKLNHENFYDSLLIQDGHRLERIRPPRDLLSWQQSQISGILTDKPTVVGNLEPVAIQQLLRSYPFERFPVIENGKPIGVLTRKDAQAAQAEKRPPKLEPVTTCRPDQTIRELQTLLINSTTQFVVVVDEKEAVLGVITLHDLLRAEVQKAEA
jgi:CIC family chloride channel protein